MRRWKIPETRISSGEKPGRDVISSRVRGPCRMEGRQGGTHVKHRKIAGFGSGWPSFNTGRHLWIQASAWGEREWVRVKIWGWSGRLETTLFTTLSPQAPASTLSASPNNAVPDHQQSSAQSVPSREERGHGFLFEPCEHQAWGSIPVGHSVSITGYTGRLFGGRRGIRKLAGHPRWLR